MKKYIVFEFDPENPFGGFGDIRAATDEYTKAIKHIQESKYQTAYVVDRDTWEILLEKGNRHE